jgi:glyoxylase-like metal-dependent hydrolase (beta-lactamase superfamily II)
MTGNPHSTRYNWLIVQAGQLPFRPDHHIDYMVEHRCTSTLIWPDGAQAADDNTLITDPCFTADGFRQAVARLAGQGLSFHVISHAFATHPHGDHMPHLPAIAPPVRFRLLSFDEDKLPADLSVVRCPGHHPLLTTLVFTATDGQSVWAAGDAVLDEEWLRAWVYYWPNGYSPADVVETWRSTARIVAGADVIIPGHGPAIAVTADLGRDLLASFPAAPYADQCPDVADRLRARIAALSGERRAAGA